MKRRKILLCKNACAAVFLCEGGRLRYFIRQEKRGSYQKKRALFEKRLPFFKGQCYTALIIGEIVQKKSYFTIILHSARGRSTISSLVQFLSQEVHLYPVRGRKTFARFAQLAISNQLRNTPQGDEAIGLFLSSSLKESLHYTPQGDGRELHLGNCCGIFQVILHPARGHNRRTLSIAL